MKNSRQPAGGGERIHFGIRNAITLSNFDNGIIVANSFGIPVAADQPLCRVYTS